MGCGSSSAYPPWYWEDSEFSTQTDQRFATKTTVLETTYVAGNEDETKEVIDSNKYEEEKENSGKKTGK